MTVNEQAPETTRTGIVRMKAGRGHSYRIDGQRVPGVTTLIGAGLPKPALQYWAARTVAEYVADASPESLDALRDLGRGPMVAALKGVPWQARDTAALRGNEVHRLAQQLVHGEQVDVPEEYAGHVDSAVAFMDDWQVKPVLAEATVGSRLHSYCGTLDLVADVRTTSGWQRAIIDYKATRSGIFPEIALQLAAYRWADVYVDDDGAEHPMAELEIDCGLAVWVRADGYDVYPVVCDMKVYHAFRHVAYAGQLAGRLDEWLGEAIDRSQS